MSDRDYLNMVDNDEDYECNEDIWYVEEDFTGYDSDCDNSIPNDEYDESDEESDFGPDSDNVKK